MMDLRGVRTLFRGVYVTKMAERTNGLTSLVERGILKREREREAKKEWNRILVFLARKTFDHATFGLGQMF